MAKRDKSLAIWRFSDHRAGHDSQSLGLGQAIIRQAGGQLYELDCLSPAEILTALIRGRHPHLQSLPRPNLLIGAGHGTHLSLLVTRFLYGGLSVVLMQPSLPSRWFDVCLIPAHDRPHPRKNIIITDGALNLMAPSASKERGSGMILVGGPSRHHGWEESALIEQLSAVTKDRATNWSLTDSPRTPAHTRHLLQSLVQDNLSYHPFETTGPDWLTTSLGAATTAWVTADSMSMIYEALTAGAAVGVIEVPERRAGRTASAVTRLVENGRVTTYKQWLATGVLTMPGPLDEAGRCATLVLRRLAGEV